MYKTCEKVMENILEITRKNSGFSIYKNSVLNKKDNLHNFMQSFYTFFTSQIYIYFNQLNSGFSIFSTPPITTTLYKKKGIKK